MNDQNIALTDDAIADPKALASALRPLLTRHPVPQSDERTRGMIFEFGWGDGKSDSGKPAWADVPALQTLLALFTGASDAINILAINENPPAPPDAFMLRFDDGSEGEFRRPGLGTAYEPMANGTSGIAYTRGPDLVDFRRLG